MVWAVVTTTSDSAGGAPRRGSYVPLAVPPTIRRPFEQAEHDFRDDDEAKPDEPGTKREVKYAEYDAYGTNDSDCLKGIGGRLLPERKRRDFGTPLSVPFHSG